MKSHKSRIAFFLLFILLILKTGVGSNNQKHEPVVDSTITQEMIHFNEYNAFSIKNDNIENIINTTMTSEYFPGYNLYYLEVHNKSNTYQLLNQILLITDMEGKIYYEENQEKYITAIPIEFINSTTLLCRFYDDPGHAMLWNIKTNKSYDFGTIGHHEIEYNPINNSIFTFKNYYVDINGSSCRFDELVEFKAGKKIWSLHTDEFITFDQWCPFKDPTYESVDLTHSNSIFHDSEEDSIYFNMRNTNTFYKIDHQTGGVIWGLGEYGNFTLYDKYSNQKDNLFYHAHAVEKIDDYTFILFDNDFHNQTNALNKRSRMVEITINESTMTANETWVWGAPEEYYSPYWGDVDKLPNGNRLGTFGTLIHPNTNLCARIVEVNESGDIVWEMNFKPTENELYGVYRTERFNFSPYLQPLKDFIYIDRKQILIRWQTYYNFKNKHEMPGFYEFYLNETLIESANFTFSKFWKSKELSFIVKDLDYGIYNASLVVYDEGWHKTVSSIYIIVNSIYTDDESCTSFELSNNKSTQNENSLEFDIIFYLGIFLLLVLLKKRS